MPRTVVISGGSRGLGAVLTKAFLAEDGYNVAICSRSRSEFVDSLLADDHWKSRVLFKQVDLSDRTAVSQYVREIRERFGTVHVLVNNAGVAVDGVLALQTDLAGFRGLSVYSMTKAGLDGFTRSMARELGDRGITVNSVAPGFLETEMTHGLSPAQKDQIVRRTPAGRLGRSEDVAGVVKFLCSDAAEFVTGQTIIVDGGAMA